MTIFDRYVSSPIYRVAPEHRWAVAALLVVGVVALWRVRRGVGVRAVDMGAVERFFVAAAAVAVVANVGLSAGHVGEAAGWWLLTVAAAEAWVVGRVLRGRNWRGVGSGVLVTALAVNLGWSVAGVTVDQAGLATALVQAGALAAAVEGVEGGRLRRAAASTLVVGAVGLTTLASWAGAVAAGEGGERLGDTPLPGVLLPRGVDRPPTDAERAAAARLVAETVDAIARFEDVDVAAAAGYDVAAIRGPRFHAENPTFKSDGVVLDPWRPETLVYEPTPDGPVLLGAMYEMEAIGVPGPAVGGPLTVWHAHDHLCFSLLPPGLAGFESPLGGCGLGSVSLPVSNEMIHVWTLPGVPEQFHELDDEWLARYLAGEASGD